MPIVGLVVGYPAEDPPLRPRIPLAFMHHADRYRDMQPSEIAEVVAAINDFWADEGFVAGILTGGWWTEGEESLEKALIRQAMRPA